MNCIWAKNRLERHDELCFVLEAPRLERGKLRIVAKDVFNLRVNGRLVSYGPARAGHGYLRVEEIDLSPYLTEEKNFICVNVLSYYTLTLAFAMEPPCFGAELLDGEAVVKTTADFACYEMIDRIRKVERMSSQRGFVEYYKQSKCRQHFYEGDTSLYPRLETEAKACAKLLPARIKSCGYESQTAREIDSFPVAYGVNPPWHCDFVDLLEDAEVINAYPRKDCERVLSKSLNSFVKATGETPAYARIYDLGRDYTGLFSFRVHAKGSVKVYLVYDDVLQNGDIRFEREQIIHGLAWELDGGEYALHSAEAYTARYIKVVVEGDAEVEDVRLWEVKHSETGSFSFACEDGDLEKIVLSAKRSFEQNAVDIYTDCPSRERAGWLCDSYFTSKAEWLFTGKNTVQTNHIENYCLFRGMPNLPKYVLPMCYPSESRTGNFIPNYLAWYILEYIEYEKKTGDTHLRDAAYEKTQGIMKFFADYENEYGFLEDLPAWVFVEWSKSNDFTDGVNFPSNMLYCAALEASGEFFGVPEYTEKGKKLREQIEKWSFNGEFFRDNALRVDGKLKKTENYSETCQYYAMFFGFTSSEKYAALNERMVRDFGCTRDDERVYPQVYKSNMFIGNYLRLAILCRMGRYEEIVKECKPLFLGMANLTETLWENVAPKEGKPIGGSCCHGFTSAVAAYLVQALTGYCGFDRNKREVYFTKSHLSLKTAVTLPLAQGVCEILIGEEGEKISLPDGYALAYV